MFDEHQKLYAVAKRLFAGGVTAATRAHQGLGHPFYVARAEGPWIEDVEGHRLVDLCMSNGAGIFGHGQAYPPEDSDFWGYESPWVIKLAERLQQSYPVLERIRFCLSGTEAVYNAVCLARITTGRRLFAKFAGMYHGNCDPLQVNWTDYGEPISSDGTCEKRIETTGLHPSAKCDVVVLPFNNVEVLSRFFRSHGRALAGVILEPTAINAGCVKAVPGLLAELRRECNKCGAVLIFDEILCGFRCEPPPDVRPDLMLLGKVAGGGWPLSVVGGCQQFMRPLSEGRFHSGTHAGSALLAWRAVTSLEALTPSALRRLEARTQSMVARLNEMFLDSGHNVRIEQCCDRFAMFFDHPPECAIVRPATTVKGQRMLWRFTALACENGAFMRPQIHHGISLTHTDEVLDLAMRRLKRAVVALKQEEEPE